MPYDGRFVAVGVYAHVATLLLPVVCRTGVGAVWGVRKRSYPAEFIAMLATVVNMLALVFHSLMTTRLDNAQLLGVGSATLLGLAVAAVFSGIALRSLHIASAHARARGYVSQHRQPRASHRATGVRRHRAGTAVPRPADRSHAVRQPAGRHDRRRVLLPDQPM